MARQPWYNIQFIPNYVSDFAYIGPHVENRHFLIKDDVEGDGDNYI